MQAYKKMCNKKWKKVEDLKNYVCIKMFLITEKYVKNLYKALGLWI